MSERAKLEQAIVETRHKLSEARTALTDLSIKLHDHGRLERELGDVVNGEAERISAVLREFDRVTQT